MYSFLEDPIDSACLPEMNPSFFEESDECFVDIYAFSDRSIKVCMQYAKDKLDSAIGIAYVRKSVAEKLLAAKKLLPEGYSFEILDAWRPYGVQLSLYNAYLAQIRKNMPPDITDAELQKKVCEFVSYPDKRKKISYVHSSGGAVDLTIVDADGNRLDMGSAFDEFSPKSYTMWFENNASDLTVRNNRRLLYNALCSCGFTNYPAEWWHYDFGDAFWSFYTEKKAIYTSKFELKELTFNE